MPGPGSTAPAAITAATPGLALVAVGGYGRRELAPHSDLDLVLVHLPEVDPRGVAESLWYPFWDAGVRLDHAVRRLDEVTATAAADVRVALGLLDARHVAGDAALTLRMRSEVLTGWRRGARLGLPRLRDLVSERVTRSGELAHVAVPDLKESGGGLRDATVLTAMAATWLVDVPHADLDRCRRQLLDVRDVLHRVAGRASDRVAHEVWQPLAEGLELPDAEAAQRLVRGLGRRMVHLSRLTWSRVDHVLGDRPPARPGAGSAGGASRSAARSSRAAARSSRSAARSAPDGHPGPPLLPLAPGVALAGGEVVLDRGADPTRDPLLLLRASSVAAEERRPLAPATAARLAAVATPLPEPWPAEARRLFVRLLAAGPGLLPVWETLDETGAWDLLLPEWATIRLLPHASVVHRFTVDRHVVETCVEAGAFVRRVARPDLLLLAAVLHDLGKGDRDPAGAGHSALGAPGAAAVAARVGLPPEEVAVVARLVRHHLLLVEAATTRDLDDPATTRAVAAALRDRGTLDLLEALTEADARATSAAAWTTWRAGLVHRLAGQVRRTLAGDRPELHGGDATRTAGCPQVPDLVRRDPDRLHVEVAASSGGARVTVAGRDRAGHLAAVAGALALLHTEVRSARLETADGVAVSVWDVSEDHADLGLLAQRVEAVLAGVLDPARRLRLPPPALPPSVVLHRDASTRATVLEVRTEDRPGVLWVACDALARLGFDVRSAHVATVGPQAHDVFYLQQPGAGPLTTEQATGAVHAVRRALGGAVSLDV